MLKTISRFMALSLLTLTFILGSSACSERMMGVSVTGYNHSKIQPIFNFTVNGAMGSNLNQESGGGASSCCVSIPERWRPGLKATVVWVYDQDQGDPNPVPPPQEKVVEIPEYKHGGRVWVHFYDDHEVKIVVSPCSIRHPYYPMSEQDKLPWVDDFTKEAAIESHNKGGATLDC